MPSSSTARFRKLISCPRSEMLLTYSRGALGAGRAGQVTRHVRSCDFCGAEVQLLSRHAPPADALPFAAHALPAALRRLAEDLLSQPSYKRDRCAESRLEIERLTLTDA